MSIRSRLEKLELHLKEDDLNELHEILIVNPPVKNNQKKSEHSIDNRNDTIKRYLTPKEKRLIKYHRAKNEKYFWIKEGKDVILFLHGERKNKKHH